MILPACVWSKPRGPMDAKRIACTPSPVGSVAREPSRAAPVRSPIGVAVMGGSAYSRGATPLAAKTTQRGPRI